MAAQKELVPANLSQKVKDVHGQVVELYIEICKEEQPLIKAYLYAKIPNKEQFKEIGGISYYPVIDFKGDRYVQIEHMRNLSSYKKVGTALHEHVFRESYELGCTGHVRVSVGSKSHYFHYRCGFSPYPSNFFPEAEWKKLFARLREQQPEGRLKLPDGESWDELQLSDEQIHTNAKIFNMNTPIVAISREIDLVKKTLLTEGKVQFKTVVEDQEEETYLIYTRS